MFKLTRKSLWAHKVRFALTGLAVVLGVAFMAGTMILTDTMGRTFDNLFATANDGVDVVVRQGSSIDSEMVEVRDRVDASLVETIRGVDGVANVAGTVEGFAQIVKADGSMGETNGLGATIGAAWIDDSLNPFDLYAGDAPTAGEVVIDKATVDSEGWSVGDVVTVFGNDAPADLVISGVATFGEIDGLPGSTLVAVDTVTAQSMFGEEGRFDSVVVAGDGSRTTDELAASIASAIGDDSIEVITGEADTADQRADFKEDLSFFNQFLMAFAYIALFVGMFIIHNTFSIVLAQRMKDMAMLRAIGARRAQVLRSIVIESLVVGIVASAVGLVAGVGMSYVLRGMLGAAGLEIPGGDIVVSSGTITTAFLVGSIVTLLSSIAPAIRASRIAPIAALRDVAVDRTGSSLKRTVAGLVLAGVGVVGFAAGMVAEDGGDAVQLLSLGTLGVILGVFVLGPVIARPAMHVFGVVPAAVSGTTGRLARNNASRNPRRTAATAAALMVGVTLVGFITILASSTKASIGAAVDRSLRADYVVDSGTGFGAGGLSPLVEVQLDALPEVDAVSPLRSSPVGLGDGTTELYTFDAAEIDTFLEIVPTAGSFADLVGGGVAVGSDTASQHDLQVGDIATIRFAATGEQELEVKAIYTERDLFGSPLLVDVPVYEANVADQLDHQVWLTTADGVDAETSGVAISAVLEAWPNAALQDQAGFKESLTTEIDQMLNLIYGLLALAVIIALIGIANTLALSVHERRRELGLLRAVGMGRRQVRTAVRWESVLISILGTAFGFALAVGMAWGIVTALDDEGVTTFVIPGAQLTVIVGLAAVAGVLAAVGPARRAARLNVLDAIATS